MTLKDFVEAFGDLPHDTEILITDRNGDNVPVKTFSSDLVFDGINIGIEELTPELKSIGYSEDFVVDGKQVITLWPD